MQKSLGIYFSLIRERVFLSIFERKRGVPGKGKTENLGDFDGFQPSGMPTFQILRFAEKVVNPCKSPSKQGKKKAAGRFLRVILGGENKKASRFDWRRII